MARIRSIKPGFFSSDDVTPLSFRARLTWIGLWTYCDDHGRGKDNTRLIKAAVWPLDELSFQDVEDDLTELAKHKRIVRYRRDDHRLLAVTSWHFHQSVNRPGKTLFPAPPPGSIRVPEPGENRHCARCWRDQNPPGALTEPSRTTPGTDSGDSPGQSHNGRFSEPSRSTHGALTSGKETEKGTETDTPSFGGGVSVDSVQHARGRERSLNRTRTPPPSPRDARCVEHEHDDDPPRCGACARARHHAEQADHERRVEARRAELRATTADKRRAIADCPMCDDNGYWGAALCNHDPHAEARASRGRARVNELMGWTSSNEPEPP